MAEITSIKVADRHVPQKDSGEVFAISMNFALSATIADDTDTITLFEMQRAGTIVGARLNVSATLGADARVQLRAGGKAITAASTAAQANDLIATAMARVDIGDKIDLLVSGADISAAANVQLDLLVCHNPVINAAAVLT